MGPLRTELIRAVLWRLAGLAATLVVTALLLALFVGGGSPLWAFLDALRLEFGTSASLNVPVGPAIAERLAVTLPLAIIAMAIAVVAGYPLGFLARNRESSQARGILAAARVLIAIPPLWLGMILAIVFAGVLKWFAPGGFVPWQQSFGGALASLLLPALALALPLAALLVRATARWSAGVDKSPVVFAARLHGLTISRAIYRHGFRPSALPLLDYVGVRFGLVLAAAMVVENVFYLPGLGRMLFNAALAQDANLVRGTLFVVIGLAALVRFLFEAAALLAIPSRREAAA